MTHGLNVPRVPFAALVSSGTSKPCDLTALPQISGTSYLGT